jgi:ketosteroid isomerase-like protein
MARIPCAVVALAVLGLVAAGARADPVRDAVEAANRSFVERFLAGDMQGVAALYSEDARVIAPGAAMASGRAAIAAFWAGARESTKGVRLETDVVESAGDLAFEDGVVHLVGADGRESSSRYLVVWKRVGGRWLLHRDTWNDGPEPDPRP